MHVEIITDGNPAPFRLTGERAEEGVSGGNCTPSRQQSLQDYVDSPNAKGNDLGNLGHGVEFSITRTWENEGIAALYALKHAENVPPAGRVRFIATTSGGDYVGEAYLDDAVIAVTNATWEGCASICSYRILGGKMT